MRHKAHFSAAELCQAETFFIHLGQELLVKPLPSVESRLPHLHSRSTGSPQGRVLSPLLFTLYTQSLKGHSSDFTSCSSGRTTSLRSCFCPSIIAPYRASASCKAADRKALQWVVTTAQKIIGCLRPNWMNFSALAASHLFELLPSGRRYRTFKTRTNKLKISSYPKAV